ncbi:protein NUCLEAR FUSION DEFECTIVE 6, chloroplastic/mitochondrial isoform X1 [Prunus avium]|uniref:Protein NUCLEAR FUSION DEFECTIVE 6, chloroplastic/mitochondrial isoform X1 n=1 Tax=Prunus avium TaxID=42229 RepID=A0A6P5SJM6_PRUAV|nr:protein NUCLEAR FUSION DEFECTIVE 6, chloroplastic/mitochondrial isoform X1 [Prunus avium]
MASACRQFANRASLSSIRSSIRSNAPKSPTSRFPLPTSTPSTPLRRSSLSRPPGALGCVQSLLPLHSAVAAARMTSSLSITSRSCRALSQGTLCRTSPGL